MIRRHSEKHITIQYLPDGSANGENACNSYSTTYKADNTGKLSFTPIISTRIACDLGMDFEQAFFKALSQVQYFQFQGTKLTLTSEDARTVLHFSMPPK